MAVTQRYTPPFAVGDVDAVVLDFAPAPLAGETLLDPVVSVDGGFSVNASLTRIGSVNPNGVFVDDAAGSCVFAMLTAITAGAWYITFTIATSAGRLLHRTQRADIAPRS